MTARSWQLPLCTLAGALLLASEARADRPAADPGTPVVDDYRITILADAIPGRKTVGEWGFSALVEITGGGVTRRFLFDTGDKPGTVLANAAILGIDLCTVQDVVLSHHHADHTGGLLTLRSACAARGYPDALHTAWVGGPEILFSRQGADGQEKNPLLSAGIAQQYVAGGGIIDDGQGLPRQFLLPGVYLTGRIPRVHDEKTYLPVTPMQMRNAEGQLVEELVPEDQAVVIHTSTATVVLTGCAHAGAVNTVLAARSIVGGDPAIVLAGGLHWFQMERGDKHEVGTIDWEADVLAKQLGLAVMMGGHCTGFERFFYVRDLAKLDASQAAMAAVGTVLARDPRFTFTLPQAFNIPMEDKYPK